MTFSIVLAGKRDEVRAALSKRVTEETSRPNVSPAQSTALTNVALGLDAFLGELPETSTAIIDMSGHVDQWSQYLNVTYKTYPGA